MAISATSHTRHDAMTYCQSLHLGNPTIHDRLITLVAGNWIYGALKTGLRTPPWLLGSMRLCGLMCHEYDCGLCSIANRCTVLSAQWHWSWAAICLAGSGVFVGTVTALRHTAAVISQILVHSNIYEQYHICNHHLHRIVELWLLSTALRSNLGQWASETTDIEK
eukprot:6194218-Pleurochrysis_carterae.AAC.1